MKTSIKSIVTAAALMFMMNAQAQQTNPKAVAEPHHGFNFSFYMGGAGGNAAVQVSGMGKAVFNGGASLRGGMHLGYATHNWAFGFADSYTTYTIRSIDFPGVSLPAEKTLFLNTKFVGGYVTRYFMPYNVFLTGEIGTGLFEESDEQGNAIARTQPGFGCNFKAGKEFLLGKKKITGLGLYADLAYMRCHDQEPDSGDVFSFLSPGLGVSFSVH